jgi:hypothetical protein
MEKDTKELLETSIQDILDDEWIGFSKSDANFIGADDITKYKAEKIRRKRNIRLFKTISTILVILVGLAIILAVAVNSASASWVPLRTDGNKEKQDKVAWAWQISQDPNWIMTIERESGFDNAISHTGDYGECQLNYRYHKAFINDPKFQDWRIRILYCAEVYARDNGRSFAGFYVRNTVKNRFVWFNN